MQPVVVVRSSVSGVMYLNGRMVGEADAGHMLSLPVSPNGTVFLELHPFARGYLPLALRMPLSRGAPLLASADSRFCIALWPGGVIEIELLPERIPAPPQFLFQSGDIRFYYMDAVPPVVRCDTPAASFFHTLPDEALPPSFIQHPSAHLLAGTVKSGGQYALLLSEDGASVLLTLSGQNLSLLDDGSSLRILHLYHDTVGHAALQTWSYAPEGWRQVLSEPMWMNGIPAWPQTPADTALAAIEAAQLGLMNEAASYFSPVFACAELLSRLASFDGCTLLRSPLPDGTSAVGVTKLDGALLRVFPVRYSASPGGIYGAYQLESLEIDEAP